MNNFRSQLSESMNDPKRLNEQHTIEYELDFRNCTSYPDSLEDLISDNTANGILIYPRDDEDDNPLIPWDAGVSFGNDYLVISGNLGPGGPGRHNNSCEVRVHKEEANEYYRFIIELEEGNEPILDALEEVGIEYTNSNDEDDEE